VCIISVDLINFEKELGLLEVEAGKAYDVRAI